MRKSAVFIIAAAAATLGAVGSALSADLPMKAPVYKAPPPPPPAFNWTGFYIGGNVGATWMGNSDASYFQPLVPGFSSASLSDTSVIGGAQAGYNWEFNRTWLIGVEADIAARKLSDSVSTLPFGGNTNDTVVLSQEQTWVGTVRGRVGLVWDKLLVYGTGGFAYGNVKNGYNQVRLSTGQAYGISDSSTETGWTAGAGMEYALSNNMTFGVEYLHVDLGSQTLNLPAATVSGLLYPASSATFDAKSDMVRVKLNWIFR